MFLNLGAGKTALQQHSWWPESALCATLWRSRCKVGAGFMVWLSRRSRIYGVAEPA